MDKVEQNMTFSRFCCHYRRSMLVVVVVVVVFREGTLPIWRSLDWDWKRKNERPILCLAFVLLVSRIVGLSAIG